MEPIDPNDDPNDATPPTILVKVTGTSPIDHADETRRFHLPTDKLDFGQLQTIVANFFSTTSSVAFEYLDDENDRVMITVTQELQDAVNLALHAARRDSKPPVLRLFLKSGKPPPRAPPPPPPAPPPPPWLPTCGAQFGAPPPPRRPQPDRPTPVHDLQHLLTGVARALPGILSQIPPAVARTIDDTAASVAASVAGGARADPSTAPTAEGAHPGVTCDACEMFPIVGPRHNLKGHNFDLCSACFEPLSDDDKSNYRTLPAPTQRCGPSRSAARAERDGRKLAARFICDESIPDGTQMAPATEFVKIWKMMNVGERPWPKGTRLLSVGGDAQLSNDEVVVGPGPIAPGESVSIAMPMKAPAEPGRYIGYYRLVGPHAGPAGRNKFGQRVWAHIQVVSADDDAAVQVGVPFGVPARGGEEDDEKTDMPAPSAVELARCSPAGEVGSIAVNPPDSAVGAAEQALSEHSEWDPMVEELVEMGFEDRSTNLEVLRKTGSVKRAVRDLVSAPKQ